MRRSLVVSIVIFFLLCVFCAYKNQSQKILVAPFVVYLKSGNGANFTYLGYNVEVNYFTCKNRSYIVVEVNGDKKVFKRNFSDDPHGIYWRKDQILISIKPVVWVYRNGERIPVYEKSWNTTEILVKVWR